VGGGGGPLVMGGLFTEGPLEVRAMAFFGFAHGQPAASNWSRGWGMAQPEPSNWRGIPVQSAGRPGPWSCSSLAWCGGRDETGRARLEIAGRPSPIPPTHIALRLVGAQPAGGLGSDLLAHASHLDLLGIGLVILEGRVAAAADAAGAVSAYATSPCQMAWSDLGRVEVAWFVLSALNFIRCWGYGPRQVALPSCRRREL